MNAPDFLLIPPLVAGEALRRVGRRVRSGRFWRLPYSGAAPHSLMATPQDLHPADPGLATAIYAGHFAFGEDHVSTRGSSPFSIQPPSQEWHDALHGFGWLRHLHLAGTDLARANAGTLVGDWIDQIGSNSRHAAWDPDITAKRLISWLCHAPMLVRGSETAQHQSFMRSLMVQTRYLQQLASRARDGYPRLHVYIALTYSALCLAGRERAIRQATRDLDRDLDRQILPDGGHISRNPVILVELLADLLPLRQTYSKLGQSPSHELLSAIDRMMSALRFFRHSNGELAQFNGTGQTPQNLMANILRFDDSRGKGQQSAPFSGYERLAHGDTTVIMDTGKPISRATARRAMAGCLSFELASGANRFVMNCGSPDSSFSTYAPYIRATAAHSTASINDTASCRFTAVPALQNFLPSPLIRAPQEVTCNRNSLEGFEELDTSHDGYVRNFGLLHRRQIQLSNDGNTLNGADSFLPTKAEQKRSSHTIELRFHVPPQISASLLSSGKSILLAAPNNDAWTFTCVDAPIRLSESILFSGPGQPRKTEQIVVTAKSDNIEEIRWAFERRRKNPRSSRKKNPESKDLLDGLGDGGSP